MRKKFIMIFFLSSSLSVSACFRQGDKIALPDPRPLGSEIETYQPPADPKGASFSVGAVEPSGVLTLRQALALALMHNSRLKAYSWKIRESEARKLGASLRPNPELIVEVEDVGGTGERREFDSALITIQLSRLIELGGKRNKRERLASLDNVMAGWDYESERLDLFAEVTKSFIDVLASRQKLDFTAELLRLSEKLLAVVVKRVDAGKDSPLEKTKAEVAYSTIKIEYQRAVRELESSRRKLGSAWNADEPLFTGIAGDLDMIYPVPPIDDLAGLALENPEIARWSGEIKRLNAALDLEKAKAFPDITLSAGVRKFNDTSENLFLFGISFPLQLSDRNQAGRQLAAYELAGADEIRKSEETRVRVELADLYSALSSAYMEATELRNSVLPGAQSVFDASVLSYREGKLDYLHILDAQRTLYKVKTQYIAVLAEYHKAKTEVEKLIGRSIEDGVNFKSEDNK